MRRNLQFIGENIWIFIKSHYFLIKYEGSGIGYIQLAEENFLPLCEGNEAHNFNPEDDFEQTIAMVDMDFEEVMIEVQNSHEEVS